MRIMFMGTPDYAAECLKFLHKSGENIICALTQPDRPKGRGHKMQPTPVKEYAESAGIPVYQPNTLKDEAFAAFLREKSPDVIVVAAYGKILPRSVLAYPKHGCINAHASILPRWRGAAPIQRAIMAGDTVTGVTAMQMDDGIDTGNVICVEEVEIAPDDTFGEVHDKLAAVSGIAIQRALDMIREGTLACTEQCDADSCYAAKITKDDCAIDFSHPVKEVYNRIRALSPAPLACVSVGGKLLKIARAEMTDKTTDKPDGYVIAANGKGIDIAVGGTVLRITEVVPEGKGRMSAGAFVNGRGIAAGDVLGQ